MNRRQMDPDGNASISIGPSISMGSRDPPEATFSLNDRQLDIIRSRQQRDPSVANDRRSSKDRANEGRVHKSTIGGDAPKPREWKSLGGGSTAASHSSSSSCMTPIRTPNPCSRSNSSHVSGNDDQRAFLRSMLRKAASKTTASTTSSSSGDQNKKALVRRVLAKSMTSKGRSPATGSSKSAKAYTSQSASHFRERMRQAANISPPQRNSFSKVRSSLSRSSSGKKRRNISSAPSGSIGSNDDSAGKSVRQLVGDKMRGKGFKPVQQVATRSDTSSDFESFIGNLQVEASRQHSALWQSFAAEIQGNPKPERITVPPKREKHTFDSETRKMIQRLNGHLRKNGGVERTGLTELVNDSRYSRERANRPPLEKSVASRTSSSKGSLGNSRDTILQMRSSGELSEHSTTLSTLTEKLEKERNKEKIIIPSNNHASVEESRSNDDSQFEQLSDPGLEVTLTQFESKITYPPPPPPPPPPPRPPSTISQSLTKATALSQDSAVSKGVGFAPSSTASSGVTTSWSAQLRASSASTVSPANSVASSSAPSWASIQLRPIDKKMTDVTIPEDDTTDETLSASLSIPHAMSSISGTSSKPIELNEDPVEVLDLSMIEKTFSGCETKPIFVASPAATATSNVSGKQAGDKIDDAVVFRLKPTVGQAADGENRVVVGNKMIMMVQAPAGTQQATVHWKLPRQSVLFTLDIATQKVILTQKDSSTRKVLCFFTAADSLKFANALHDLQAVKEDKPSIQKTQDQRPGPEIIDAEPKIIDVTETESPEIIDVTDADSRAGILERKKTDEPESVTDQLSSEERALLDKFRLLRQTKTTQDALVETLSTGGASKHSKTSTLTPAEELVAQKYRRMLQMKIPVDAVRHKLRMEDISDHIVSAVLDETDGALPSVVATIPDLPSSPISTMSCSVAATIDLEAASKYKKMLMLRIPRDAVRHKMLQDQVDSQTVDFVLGADKTGDTKPPSSSHLSTEDEETAAKYRKMLKLSIPADAVQHKMKQDQVKDEIVSAVLGLDVSKPGPQTSSKLNTEESKIAEKYKKMLSLRIPGEAVRHSMIKDQVDSKIIDAVLGHDSSQAPAQIDTGSTGFKTKKPSDLDEDEQTLASQYKKLLKLQIPRDQVLARMQREGISEKIVKAVVGPSGFTRQTPKSDDDQSSKCGSKFVALHWTPLNGAALENSIWGSRKSEETAQPENREISQLIHLFQKKTSKNVLKDKRAEDASSGSSKAKLLDVTRSNNVSISLKAFKDFSFDELAEIIAFLDPLRKIRGDRILFLRDLLPTITEAQLAMAYSGSEDRLVPAEIWFRRISRVKRIETKVQVMRSMETLQTEALTTCENFRTLARAGRQVMESEKLVALLEMVLSVGNIMNQGTRTGGASGFKFDSLQRLTQTKSSDGKTTVLDFLVTVFVAKGQREKLDLLADLPDCQVASRMLVTDMTNDVKLLREALDQCSKECEAMKIDRDGPADKLDTTDKGASNKSAAFSQRDKFLQAVNTREPEPELATDPSKTATTVIDINGGIQRLEEFVLEAETLLTNLAVEKDDALDTSKKMSAYCGESSGAGTTCSLLGIVHQFATNVGSALKKYDRIKMDEEKRQRRKENAQLSKPSSPSSEVSSVPHTAGKSLVLLVNEMLNDASDQAKEDFRKGRTYENPSQRLQRIYDKEKTVASFGSPGTAIKKMDIVTAIRQREGRIDRDEVHESRSKFARIVDGIESKRETDLSSSETNTALSKLKHRLFGQCSPEKLQSTESMRQPVVPEVLQPQSRKSLRQSRTIPVSVADDVGPRATIENELSLRPSEVIQRAKQLEVPERQNLCETIALEPENRPDMSNNNILQDDTNFQEPHVSQTDNSASVTESLRSTYATSEHPPSSSPRTAGGFKEKLAQFEKFHTTKPLLRPTPESMVMRAASKPTAEKTSRLSYSGQSVQNKPSYSDSELSATLDDTTSSLADEKDGPDNKSCNKTGNLLTKKENEPELASESPPQSSPTKEADQQLSPPAPALSTPPRPADDAFRARNMIRGMRSAEAKSNTPNNPGVGLSLSREALSKANTHRRQSLSSMAHRLSASNQTTPQQKAEFNPPPAVEEVKETVSSDQTVVTTADTESSRSSNAKSVERKNLQQLARERRDSRNGKSAEAASGSATKSTRPSLASMAKMKRKEKKSERRNG